MSGRPQNTPPEERARVDAAINAAKTVNGIPDDSSALVGQRFRRPSQQAR
jgi:hypothetical protein